VIDIYRNSAQMMPARRFSAGRRYILKHEFTALKARAAAVTPSPMPTFLAPALEPLSRRPGRILLLVFYASLRLFTIYISIHACYSRLALCSRRFSMMPDVYTQPLNYFALDACASDDDERSFHCREAVHIYGLSLHCHDARLTMIE